MNKYLETLNEEVQEYLNVLSPEFPDWLLEYIYTPEMLRLDGISMACGTTYTRVYNDKYFYSTLTHSVGVALIIWNFTHDKKQTLSGLFHDIATPTFKHCIDFLNGDSETQESTEEKTEEIIKNSKEISFLLARDNIKIEEVSDYHIYPIADNDTPKLSADRLEYTLSGGLSQKRVFDVCAIKKYYNNLTVLKNENNIDELGFKDISICEQFIADIVKSLNIKKYISVKDLYNLSEKDVINLIQTCDDSYIKTAFDKFQSATRNSVYKSDEIPQKDNYCTSVKGKKRYINPLVSYNNEIHRIMDISNSANDNINNFLNMKLHKYIGFNFEFKPYEYN